MKVSWLGILFWSCSIVREKEEWGCCDRNEVPEDVMQKKTALPIALALNDPN